MAITTKKTTEQQRKKPYLDTKDGKNEFGWDKWKWGGWFGYEIEGWWKWNSKYHNFVLIFVHILYDYLLIVLYLCKR